MQVFINLQKTLMHYTWWELTIFIIGTLSFISVLVILFLPIGNGPYDFKYTGDLPVVGDMFLSSISVSLGLPERKSEGIGVLDNTDLFLSRLLGDIDSAHLSINLMTYIWTDGSMSNQIFEHLDRKLKEGVEVRIMYDDYGSLSKTPKKQIKIFEDLGGKIKAFHSLTIAPWQLLKNQKRNHRRAMIIDGTIGYTGGMTVSDEWLTSVKGSSAYHDLMFRTTGAMVGDIQEAFSELWASMTGEILSGEKFYPQKNISNIGTFNYVALASTPSADALTLQKLFLLSVLGAKQTVYISTPYFLPDVSLRKALIKKAKEGVDVRILVPNILNDSTSVYYASHHSYSDLLEGGVKIYEYQPAFIHTKAMVVDGTWSVIGSANMDNRSRKLNEESIFGIYDKPFAADLQDVFMLNLSSSKQITLEEWNKRSIWVRIREVFDQKFIQQY